MTTALVTGGLGFIGSNFIRHMIAGPKPFSIVNIDAESYGANPRNLAGVEDSHLHRFVTGDIADAKIVSPLVKEVNVIVHFAAETHVDRSISTPHIFIHSNVLGTFTLLEAARKNLAGKFIYISTDEVYGSAVTGTIFDEMDRFDPSSPYAATKAAGDVLVQAYHRTYGLDTVILRCTNNFGPYQFPEKFIPKTIINTLLSRKVPIYGDGKQIRDWIYVQDFCSAIESAIEEAPPGAIYNVSAGNEITNIEVAKLILAQLGRPSTLLEFVADRPGHDYRYSLDSSKIRKELDWEPSHNFPEALRETVNWYVKNESWWKPLISDKILSKSPWTEKW